MTDRRSTAGIFGDLDVEVEIDAPIGTDSWFCAGGSADILLHPKDPIVLAEIVRRCRRSGMPLRIIGEGANLLVADEGVGGIVVRLDAPAFRSLERNADGEVDLVRIGAGADLARSLMDLARSGLSGLEVLMGVPASIGGAVRMNAGGRYGSIGDTVHAIACLDDHGEMRVYSAEELEFGYRRTNIVDPIVLWGVFRVRQEDPVELRARIKEIAAYKKSTQPLAEKSAGCMFRNPVDPATGELVSAGRIIDECGLKGTTVGSATVSEVHANFITIARGGRANDAIELGDRIVEQVRDRRGIELEREVVVWKRESETP